MPFVRRALSVISFFVLSGYVEQPSMATDRPIVQLAVQPTNCLDNPNCVANVMLRELQRQAVLLAAREELGLRTRDMALCEPFSADASARVATFLCESQLCRGGKARLSVSRFQGKLATDRYAMEAPHPSRNTPPRWMDFAISNDPIVDYPAFVVDCELASRGAYLQAIKAGDALARQPAQPTGWVLGGSADERAIQLLRRMDIFSQYFAVRKLHAQIRTDGASVDRIEALVRGYANLNQLTQNQWSIANKVFAARALLYAQRLVVHEQSAPSALYARAYAEAMASLHAAAMKDLDIADNSTDVSSRPEWEPVIRGFCRFDFTATDQTVGWRYLPLEKFLHALISFDDYPHYLQQRSVDQAVDASPATFVLRTYASEVFGDSDDAGWPSPFASVDDVPGSTDRIVGQLPILTAEAIQYAELPVSVLVAARKLSPSDESFTQLAALRDTLAKAAASDTGEPSLGLLACLIEEQEFAGVVRQAISCRSGSGGLQGVQAFAARAKPILEVHPWGPYVEALGIDASIDADRQNQTLDRVNDRDLGGWVVEALREITVTDPERQILNLRWQTPAALLMDDIVDDFTDDTDGEKARSVGLENYLCRLRQTSPHSAMLMDSWLRSIPVERIVSDGSLFEQTMSEVEKEFVDRPAVVNSAADWCDRRGEFARSIRLLRQIDQTSPTDQTCERLAQLCWRLSYRESAIAYLLRGIKLGVDSGLSGELYQRLASYLIEDRQYDRALSYLQQSADTSTAQVWLMMARCYELMGKMDQAADCLNQATNVEPLSIEQYYMWAKRVGRRDVNQIGQRAAAAFFLPTDDYERAFFMLLADGKDRKALDLMRKNLNDDGNSLDFGEALVLAVKLKDTAQAAELLKKLPAIYGDDLSDFGTAMRLLASAVDPVAGTRAFDAWVAKQRSLANAVDWYSIAGRYLVATGHADLGRRYLLLAVSETQRERENYFLAWRELKRLGARNN